VTEENKYLDTLYQSKFSDFEAEPPATVWNNIHTELHGKGGGSINPVNLAVLAALVLISGLLGFSIMKDAPNNDSNIVLGDQAINLDESSNTIYAQLVEPRPSSEEKAMSENTVSTKPSTDIDPILSETDRTANSNNQHSAQHVQQANISFAPSFSEETRLAKMKARRSFSIHASIQTVNTENILVRDSKYHSKFAGVNDGERRYNRRATWQLGMFFTPAVSFYPDDSIPNQRSYTFDVSAKWIKNEFFIESGLGLSFSSDDGKYAIDYEKFLGSYDDVYNVTYDTTANGAVVPIYHTNVVDVYDSISSYKIEKTSNRYTYLQIPVYVGFHKEVNRFGWFVKGGPIFSILLNENVPQPDAGNDKIVGYNQRMASRVSTNWQFAVSAGMTYQLSNKVSIAIEPTFRYYLNSQYERKYISTRHPYSLGLRTGLLFNF
jgi:hypothetical protein